MVYVTPAQDMTVRVGQHVTLEGRVYHHYLAHWAEAWDVSVTTSLDIIDTGLTVPRIVEINNYRPPRGPPRSVCQGAAGSISTTAATWTPAAATDAKPSSVTTSATWDGTFANTSAATAARQTNDADTSTAPAQTWSSHRTFSATPNTDDGAISISSITSPASAKGA